MRHSDLPVDDQFIGRWSPRAFTDATLDEASLHTMLEAARWAPSASNSQPWRFVYGRRGTPAFDSLLAGLLPLNQAWARYASALVVLVTETKSLSPRHPEPRPLTHAQFDCGAAWMSLALQAHLLGWQTHGMAGIDAAALQASMAVPADHQVLVAIAIGKLGDKALLPDTLQARETPSPRKALADIAFEGRFPG